MNIYLLAVFTFLFLGFAFVSSVISRHLVSMGYRISEHGKLPVRQHTLIKFIGFTLIAIAAVIAVISQGVSFGVVYYCGILTLAALLLAMLLSYRPHWVIRACFANVVILGLCSVIF